MSAASQEGTWSLFASNNAGLKLFPGNAVTLQLFPLSAHQEAARRSGETLQDQYCDFVYKTIKLQIDSNRMR